MDRSKNRDELTHLPSREAMLADLGQAIKEDGGLSLALIDIDNFMQINDRHGHAHGDLVLCSLARYLHDALPYALYRVSGDEFGIVMTDIGLEQAFLQMEELRSSLESVVIDGGQALQHHVTVTIGVANYPRDAKDVVALLRVADSALHAAKSQGRNQVALAPNDEMVMKSCYYASSSLRALKALAERIGKKESVILREALDDVLRKYDQP